MLIAEYHQWVFFSYCLLLRRIMNYSKETLSIEEYRWRYSFILFKKLLYCIIYRFTSKNMHSFLIFKKASFRKFLPFIVLIECYYIYKDITTICKNLKKVITIIEWILYSPLGEVNSHCSQRLFIVQNKHIFRSSLAYVSQNLK